MAQEDIDEPVDIMTRPRDENQVYEVGFLAGSRDLSLIRCAHLYSVPPNSPVLCTSGDYAQGHSGRRVKPTTDFRTSLPDDPLRQGDYEGQGQPEVMFHPKLFVQPIGRKQ